MPRLQAKAPNETVVRAAAFDYRSEQRALEARVRRMVESIAETTASLPADPFEFSAHDTPAARPFRWQWRSVNWGFVGALLFTFLAWWVILTSAVPALHAILSRVTA